MTDPVTTRPAPGAGEPGARVEVPGGQGLQLGDHNRQTNVFANTYVNKLVVKEPPASPTGPVVVGDVPQEPAAFQPRTGLLEALRTPGPGAGGAR